MDNWKGEERRAPEGVILAVMNHVQETLEHHTERMDKKFDHVDRRIEALITSINSYMAKQDEIDSAFLKHMDGKPDYSGHRNDHEVRKNVALWWQGVKDKTLTKIIEWASVAICGWLFYVIWDAFLKGPKH